MMLAREVPRARCIRCWLGTPCQVRVKTTMGTMINPPPTPSNPARIPTTTPSPK